MFLRFWSTSLDQSMAWRRTSDSPLDQLATQITNAHMQYQSPLFWRSYKGVFNWSVPRWDLQYDTTFSQLLPILMLSLLCKMWWRNDTFHAFCLELFDLFTISSNQLNVTLCTCCISVVYVPPPPIFTIYFIHISYLFKRLIALRASDAYMRQLTNHHWLR